MIYISFRFDDGYSSQYDIASKLLKKYDMVASYYIITNLIDTIGRITTKQLQKLAKSGNEIGSHTKSHSNNWLECTHSEQLNEIVESKKALQFIGIRPKIFCFPKMKTTEFTEKAVRKYYKAFFKEYVSTRVYSVSNNKIPSIPTKFGIDLILSEINKKSKRDEWLVITFHEISPNPSEYGVTIKNLYKIIFELYKGIQNGTHKNVTVYEGYKLFSKNN